MSTISIPDRIARLTPATPEGEVVQLIYDIAAEQPGKLTLDRFVKLISDNTHVRVKIVRDIYRNASQPKDKCHFCKGERGGVPGNENIVHGMTICDYCHADIITVERAVRDETLVASKNIVDLTISDFAEGEPVKAALESVRLTSDGRWQSPEAIRLWAEASGWADKVSGTVTIPRTATDKNRHG